MINGKTLCHSSQDTNYCRVRMATSSILESKIVTERLAPSEYYIFEHLESIIV
jgi:hypothetical protein